MGYVDLKCTAQSHSVGMESGNEVTVVLGRWDEGLQLVR